MKDYHVKNTRLLVLGVVIFLFGAVTIGRLFWLQVLENPFYSALASRRQEVYKDLFPQRGVIYTREKEELYPLVANRDYYLVYAEPVKITDAKKVVDQLTPILALTEEEWQPLLTRLSDRQDVYAPIKHKVAKKQVEQIEALKLDGIGAVAETYRFYPEKSIGGHIFGFVGYQNDELVGQYGLEGYFNKDLAGQAGILKSVKDAVGSLITVGPRSVKKAQNGVDLVLTIDRNVQFTACQKLKDYVSRFSAEGGSVIIMKPQGEIIAMCSEPDFDPDKYNEVKDINFFNNPAIFNAYEPGSVYKMITMAAGIDLGKISPQTTYVDSGELKIGGFTIKNSDLQAHGEVTMSQALDKSLNTAAIYVEQLIGKEEFKKYVKAFGFGQKSGITLDTESIGDISSLDKAGEIYGITASFGQGIAVTSLQLINAFATVANQGAMYKPYIVSEIIHPDGKKEAFTPQKIKQVITPKTAAMVTGMLISVVENGYGNRAKVKGYYLGGKTGTAQVAGPHGGYGDKTIHTFVGFGPVSKPAFVMLTKLDNPKGPRFAESSSVPLFGELSAYLLNYYGVLPDY